MAKVKACNTSDLSISLDSPQSFLPGQTITGFVCRTSRWVSTDTDISIALHGRCNTKLFSRDSYQCRSSIELFGQNGVLEQLYSGSLHIKSRPDPEENKWRFSIGIPQQADASFLESCPLNKAAYLPLHLANQHGLPPSFDLGRSGLTASQQGYAVAEYYLEATLTSPSSSKAIVSRLPIQIRCESSPFPITDFDIKLHSRQSYEVISKRSNPTSTNTRRCSIGHKVGRALRLSKAPSVAFCLEISVPSVLQIQSPYHIPFEIRAVPQWADTRDYSAKYPRYLNIRKLTIGVRSTLSIMGIAAAAPGPIPAVREQIFTTKTVLAEYAEPKNFHDKDKQTLPSKASLFTDSPLNGFPLTIPIGDDTASLDLGELLGFNLQHSKDGVEVPTFMTYNMKRTYELEWKMSLNVDGETLKVKGKCPVLIMEKTDQGRKQ